MKNDDHKRIMALDWGEKRIGVAITDPGGVLAQPLCSIDHTNRDQDVREIARLASQHEVSLLVLGLPKKSEDELGPWAERILSLGKRLGRVLRLPVEFVDEFETSKEAEAALYAAHMPKDKRRRAVDMMAASLILRRYLDGQREDI